MRKVVSLLVITAALAACKVEKTGNGTYQVKSPVAISAQKPATDGAQTNPNNAGKAVKDEASDFMKGVRDGWNDAKNSPKTQQARAKAAEIGRKAEQGAGKAAVAAGDAIKSAGEKAQADANKAPAKTSTHH